MQNDLFHDLIGCLSSQLRENEQIICEFKRNIKNKRKYKKRVQKKQKDFKFLINTKKTHSFKHTHRGNLSESIREYKKNIRDCKRAIKSLRRINKELSKYIELINIYEMFDIRDSGFNVIYFDESLPMSNWFDQDRIEEILARHEFSGVT